MADSERSAPFGLAGLVLAASLLEALRKRELLDPEAVAEVMANALLYMQAFGADHSAEIEQETRRILEMLSKVSGQSRT